MEALFADTDGVAVGGYIGGAVTLIGGVWMVVRQFLKDRSDTKMTEKKAEDDAEKVKRVDTIGELKALHDTLRADFDSYKRDSKAELAQTRKELDAEKDRSHACDRKTDRMSSHIFYLEETIRRANPEFTFRPWTDIEGGSGPHAVLPKEPKP